MVIAPAGAAHEPQLQDVGEADHGGGVEAERHPAQVAQAAALQVVTLRPSQPAQGEEKCWLHNQDVSKTYL